MLSRTYPLEGVWFDCMLEFSDESGSVVSTISRQPIRRNRNFVFINGIMVVNCNQLQCANGFSPICVRIKFNVHNNATITNNAAPTNIIPWYGYIRFNIVSVVNWVVLTPATMSGLVPPTCPQLPHPVRLQSRVHKSNR